jgi:hypothetical protein
MVFAVTTVVREQVYQHEQKDEFTTAVEDRVRNTHASHRA